MNAHCIHCGCDLDLNDECPEGCSQWVEEEVNESDLEFDEDQVMNTLPKPQSCPTHPISCPTLPCPHTLVKCLAKVKRKINGEMGVIITGYAQKAYRIGFGDPSGHYKYTIVNKNGDTWSFETTSNLLENWTLVRDYDYDFTEL